MEKDLVTKLEQLQQNGVIFVEPNKMNDYNYNNDKQNEMPVNLEDLCIYCDLIVEDVSRGKGDGEGNTTYEVIITSNKNGTNSATLVKHGGEGNIMQGTNFSEISENKYFRAFTTNYTDINYKLNEPNYECIGINSININYDAWICPTVDIEFVDVRGLSIFSINEGVHNQVRNGDNMTGISDYGYDISDQFFSCFFKFPYPNFKLIVKGFYGEPVGYTLALNNATHTFDSRTGNFIIKANFIGYKFGILNDLTMTSLASAVSSKEGYEYWTQRVDSGDFVDVIGDNEKPLIPLVEIAKQYRTYKDELGKAVDKLNNDLNEEDAKENFYKVLSGALETYKVALKAFAEKVTQYTITNYKSMIEGALSNNNYGNSALQSCFGGLEMTKRYIADARKKVVQGLEKTVVAKFLDENEDIYHFRIPDNSLHFVAEKCDLLTPLIIADGYKPSSIPENSFNNSKQMNAVKNVHNSLVWDNNKNLDLLPYVECTNGRKDIINSYEHHYIGVLSSNTITLTTEQMLHGGNVEKGFMQVTDISGKTYDTDIKIVEIKKPKYFCKISEEEEFKNLVDAYDACVEAISGVESGSTEYLDTDEKKSLLKEFKEIFTNEPKSGTSQTSVHMKIFNPRLIVPYDVVLGSFVPKMVNKELLKQLQYRNDYNKTFGCNFHNYSCNVFARLFLSDYRFDFKRLNEILKQLELQGVNLEDKIKRETEAVKLALQSQYLTFEPSIRYLTKCLWGHVQTFLYLCFQTKNNIIQISGDDNVRKAKNLGLTRENTHLPKRYFEEGNPPNIPPFPRVYGREKISETEQERIVDKYLGTISSAENAEEVKLVNTLLYGASHYYDIVNYGVNEDVQENAYTNSTDEIRLGVYDYLSKVFDKWVYKIKSEEGLNKEWGVKEYFDDHFLFIDTFYNKIGYDLCLDSANFGKLCEEIFDNKGQSLMSFISKYMQHENCILQPVQNFMINAIENQDDTLAYYNRLFSPIPLSQMKPPKSVPYFVMIYRGKPSEILDNPYDEENENDGFMVTSLLDSNILEIPLGLKQKQLKVNEILQGYPIPAIGVTYGKQNQNYFIDIKVDTTKPMANEVATAAQYEIAGINLSNPSGNNGSSERILSFGQDLFTVYANNSYTCTITMMGCMWIQPLMYFQLNNVPMFRGTYMIQKVSHSMSPGNMTTTFTGVRMSRYSSPFVKKLTYGLSGEQQAEWQRRRERIASYDNNCPYHWYDPNESESIATESFTQEWLDTPFGTNYPKMGKKGDISTWYNKVRGKTTKLALASIILQEDSTDELAVNLHATVLFNSLVANRKDTSWQTKKNVNPDATTDYIWCGARWNAIKNTDKNLQRVLDFIDNPNTEKGKKLIKCVEKVFKESPAILIGKTSTDGHKITKEELSALWFTTGKGQAYTSVAKEKNLMFKHHDTKYYYMHPEKGKVNLWDIKPKNTDKNKSFGDKLLECIIQTFNFYEGQEIENNDKVENMEVVFDDVLSKNQLPSSKRFIFVVKDKEKKLWVSARLVDILLNCYYKNIKSIICEWDDSTTITDETDPSRITCEYSQEEQPITKISFIQNGKLFAIKEGQFPKDMVMILKKKYQDLKSKKASSYILNEFEKG